MDRIREHSRINSTSYISIDIEPTSQGMMVCVSLDMNNNIAIGNSTIYTRGLLRNAKEVVHEFKDKVMNLSQWHNQTAGRIHDYILSLKEEVRLKVKRGEFVSSDYSREIESNVLEEQKHLGASLFLLNVLKQDASFLDELEKYCERT